MSGRAIDGADKLLRNVRVNDRVCSIGAPCANLTQAPQVQLLDGASARVAAIVETHEPVYNVSSPYGVLMQLASSLEFATYDGVSWSSLGVHGIGLNGSCRVVGFRSQFAQQFERLPVTIATIIRVHAAPAPAKQLRLVLEGGADVNARGYLVRHAQRPVILNVR